MSEPYPEPPAPSYVERVRSFPPIVLIGVVVVGGVFAWWVMRTLKAGKEESSTPVSWEDRARTLLLDRGYPRGDVDSALSHYLHGGQMSGGDVTLIGVAVRTLGTPDIPNSPPSFIPTPTPPPGGGGPSTPATGVGGNSDEDGPRGFWYVPVFPAGWTSTYRGIAQQFYGNANRAPEVMAVNPGIVRASHEKLPAGSIVKVPR